MGNQERIKIGTIEYVSDDALSFGDYGGAGSYGLSNIRGIVEDHKDSIVETSYSCLRDCEVTGGRYLGKELLEEVEQFKPEVIHVFGDYSSETVYLRSDLPETEDLMKSLEDYPVLDEQAMSEVEMEWEQEAWDNWLKSDLVHTLPDDIRDTIDGLDDAQADDILSAAYSEAMEQTNSYPVAEYSGIYVDIDRIKEAFGQSLETRLAKLEAK